MGSSCREPGRVGGVCVWRTFQMPFWRNEHSTFKEQKEVVNVATANVRSEHKSSTKNLERAQRFCLSWEEQETKSLG